MQLFTEPDLLAHLFLFLVPAVLSLSLPPFSKLSKLKFHFRLNLGAIHNVRGYPSCDLCLYQWQHVTS